MERDSIARFDVSSDPALDLHRLKMCGAKVRYTEPKARKVARRYQASGVRAYRCPYCGWWHIGKPGKGYR